MERGAILEWVVSGLIQWILTVQGWKLAFSGCRVPNDSGPGRMESGSMILVSVNRAENGLIRPVRLRFTENSQRNFSRLTPLMVRY